MAEEEQLPIIGGGDNAVDEKESSEASEPTQPPADSNSEDNATDEKQDGEADEPSLPPPSSSSTEDEPEPTPRDPREDDILDACRRRDIAELQLHAESPGGFLTDELRQQAWPVLLGMPIIPAELNPDLTLEYPSWQKLPRHKDEAQVQLDVDRAFVYYPDYPTAHERNASKIHLSNLIVSVLRRHPFLHYFQGYHDIAQVFLLVLPPALRSPAVARLSLLRIRDFMLPNLSAAISQLRLIPSILAAADPLLAAHLAHTEPFFALSGTLTMYAHDITSQNEITRLFDVLLAREPVFSVYMFVQIVRARRAELFATDPDPDMLHSILSKLPQPLHLDALIAGTAALFRQHPPETLGAAWDAGISAHSVLKTARSTREAAGQSEAVGAFFFEQHLLELARAERKARVLKVLWAYRRPARAVGIAVLVGVLAYWMRRSSLPFPSVVAGPAHAAGRMLAAAWARFSGRVV